MEGDRRSWYARSFHSSRSAFTEIFLFRQAASHFPSILSLSPLLFRNQWWCGWDVNRRLFINAVLLCSDFVPLFVFFIRYLRHSAFLVMSLCEG
jgi:hypothetical protein